MLAPLVVGDALMLDPPRWRYGQATGLRACCRRGLFLDADGQLSATYWQRAGALDGAIRAAVLLDEADAGGVAH